MQYFSEDTEYKLGLGTLIAILMFSGTNYDSIKDFYNNVTRTIKEAPSTADIRVVDDEPTWSDVALDKETQEWLNDFMAHDKLSPDSAIIPGRKPSVPEIEEAILQESPGFDFSALNPLGYITVPGVDEKAYMSVLRSSSGFYGASTIPYYITGVGYGKRKEVQDNNRVVQGGRDSPGGHGENNDKTGGNTSSVPSVHSSNEVPEPSSIFLVLIGMLRLFKR